MHKRTQTIIKTQKLETIFFRWWIIPAYKSTGYTPVKNYFRLWILAEVLLAKLWCNVTYHFIIYIVSGWWAQVDKIVLFLYSAIN